MQEASLFIRSYFGHPAGVIALVVFVALALIGLLGPIFIEENTELLLRHESTSLFLVGARAPVLVTVLVVLVSSLVGIMLGTVYSFANVWTRLATRAVADALLVLPVFAIAWFAIWQVDRDWRSYSMGLLIALVACAPMIMTIGRALGRKIPSGSIRMDDIVPGDGTLQSERILDLMLSTTSAAKYVAVFAILFSFTLDALFGFSMYGWGATFEYAWDRMLFLELDAMWILPAVGTTLLAISSHLILGTAEKILQGRADELTADRSQANPA